MFGAKSWLQILACCSRNRKKGREAAHVSRCAESAEDIFQLDLRTMGWTIRTPYHAVPGRLSSAMWRCFVPEYGKLCLHARLGFLGQLAHTWSYLFQVCHTLLAPTINITPHVHVWQLHFSAINSTFFMPLCNLPRCLAVQSPCYMVQTRWPIWCDVWTLRR